MNKKLYDSNDGLRSALASHVVAAKRRVSSLWHKKGALLCYQQKKKELSLPDVSNLYNSCLPKMKSQPEEWSRSDRARSTTAGTSAPFTLQMDPCELNCRPSLCADQSRTPRSVEWPAGPIATWTAGCPCRRTWPRATMTATTAGALWKPCTTATPTFLLM